MEKIMPMNSCMEKAQPKVSEKWDFEYRDESKLLSFFAFSDYQGLDARIKFNDFFYRIVFLKYRSLIWALDGRTKVRNCGEIWFENKDVIIKNNFAIFGLPQTGSREKIQTLTAQCKLMAKTFQETGILCHQFLNETSVLYGFDKKTYAFEKKFKTHWFQFFFLENWSKNFDFNQNIVCLTLECPWGCNAKNAALSFHVSEIED